MFAAVMQYFCTFAERLVKTLLSNYEKEDKV
jgi:hypothetical protein